VLVLSIIELKMHGETLKYIYITLLLST